jgi:hypothetical protein
MSDCLRRAKRARKAHNKNKTSSYFVFRVNLFFPLYAQNYMFKIYWLAWNYLIFFGDTQLQIMMVIIVRIFKTKNPNDIRTPVQIQKKT